MTPPALRAYNPGATVLLLLRSTVSRFACPDSPSPGPHPELPSPASIASELSIIDNQIDDNCLFVSKIFVYATAYAVLNDLIVLKVLTVFTPYPLHRTSAAFLSPLTSHLSPTTYTLLPHHLLCFANGKILPASCLFIIPNTIRRWVVIANSLPSLQGGVGGRPLLPPLNPKQ